MDADCSFVSRVICGFWGSGLMIPSESRYHQPGPVAVILVNSGCSAAGLAHRRVPR